MTGQVSGGSKVREKNCNGLPTDASNALELDVRPSPVSPTYVLVSIAMPVNRLHVCETSVVFAVDTRHR